MFVSPLFRQREGPRREYTSAPKLFGLNVVMWNSQEGASFSRTAW
jgi:hypothetical protein